MIKRRKILLFLCLAISVLNVSKVYAAPLGGGNIIIIGGNENSYEGGGTGGNEGTGGNGQYSSWTYFQEGNKRIKYRYSTQTNADSNYDWKYDNANRDINVKAGTWMGIHINEIQSASWNVSHIEFKEIKRVYTCTKQIPSSRSCPCYYTFKSVRPVKVCYGDAGYNEKVYCKRTNASTIKLITDEEHDYYEPFSCPIGSTMKVEEKEIDTGDIASKTQEIYTLAHNSAAGMVGAPFSKLQIITDELDEKNNHKTETILGSLVSTSDSGVGKSGTITKIYRYKPSNICINLKTGKVRYNKECKQDEEVKINPYVSEGIEYWQYFSPLDTKSGTSLSLAIKKNDARVLSNIECHNTMNKYKNQYQNYIVSINNKALNGDYCKNGNCNNLNTSSGSDWQEVSKGCYLSTVVNFDVIQKYYFEEMKNNELKFNGYNLYYRPININNPFPTTPTENSIWYEWFNSTNKTPNLKDSFNEVTYSVAVPNKLADTIRAYNVNNPYPSFDKLSLNGTSSFLQSIGVVSLTEDKVNKLGEGTKTCIKNGTVSIGSDCS